MSFLEFINIYNPVVQFRIKGKKGYTTTIGGIYSLFTFTIIFITTILFGSDFFYRANPQVFNQNYFPEKYEKKLITKENFNIAWRLEDGNSLNFNFTNLLFPRIRYSLYQKNNQTLELDQTLYYFKLKKCSEIDINKIYIGENNPHEWYCLDFSEFPVYLGGDWTKEFVGLIGFEILFCPDDDFKSGNCTDLINLKDILDTYTGLYFSVMYPEILVTNTDLVSPLKFQLKNYFNTLNLNINKIDRLFLSKNTYKDDRGWIFSDIKESSLISGFSFDKSVDFKTENQYYKLETSLIYTFNIYMNNDVTIYFRKFMKIQDLAATVGGFMKLILLFFEVLNNLPNTYSREKMIINEIFDIAYTKRNKEVVYSSTVLHLKKINKNEFKQNLVLKNNASTKKENLKKCFTFNLQNNKNNNNFSKFNSSKNEKNEKINNNLKYIDRNKLMLNKCQISSSFGNELFNRNKIENVKNKILSNEDKNRIIIIENNSKVEDLDSNLVKISESSENLKKIERINLKTEDLKFIPNFVETKKDLNSKKSLRDIINKNALNIGFFKYYMVKLCFKRHSSEHKNLYYITDLARMKIRKKIDVIYYLKNLYKIKNFMANWKEKNKI